MNWLSVKTEELKSAADTGIASQSVVMSIASDLLYLYKRAQDMAAIPDQPVTDAHVQMVINSHEKGYAMIVPCKIDYLLAKEVQALRRAANPVTRDEDVAWWKQEAEDCKARLLELAKENEDLRRRSDVTRDEAIAKFREWNIGFPVERFKADYVIGWMLFHYPPKPAATDATMGVLNIHHDQAGNEVFSVTWHQAMRDLPDGDYRLYTEPQKQHEQQPVAEIITAGIGGYGCDALLAGLPMGTKLYASEPQPAHDGTALQNFRAAMEGIGHIRRTLEETFGGLHGTHCQPDVLVECKEICDAICSAYRQPAPVANRKLLRELVDVVWNEATESTEVPSTQCADELIGKVFDAERNNHPNAPGVPEHHQHLSELYHAQEKRLFKLAQRIKGPSFDKYAQSPSQAIDVLETAVFGQQSTNGKSELLQRAEKLAEDTAALARRVDTSACTWRYDDEEHTWDGECGASWTFLEDGPVENSMHFCPGCGKPVATDVQTE